MKESHLDNSTEIPLETFPEIPSGLIPVISWRNHTDIPQCVSSEISLCIQLKIPEGMTSGISPKIPI